ncbi:MAG TPA: DUF368 domain-containing protein, partial [Candidatus Woesebacteria bacterium]|nr:DUF368 domain-containing protein [Candidatus Woesebacteria bacterium]
VGTVPVTTPDTLLMFFFSGMIAICAMLLPGISGTFILMLIGKYYQVLDATKNVEFLILGVFVAGCITGVTLFSRVLSWLFTKHHDISVAILSGMMLGSIRKIWPWKKVIETRINSHGEEVPFIENNIVPATFDFSVLIAFILMCSGIGIMFILHNIQVTKEKTEDIPGSTFKKAHAKALKEQL